jgi:hypothetical protein
LNQGAGRSSLGDREAEAMADQAKGAAPHAGEDDRRDSRRVAIELLVRDAAAGGSFERRSGNLGLGGVWFDAFHPPPGNRVEVRFIVPGARN